MNTLSIPTMNHIFKRFSIFGFGCLISSFMAMGLEYGDDNVCRSPTGMSLRCCFNSYKVGEKCLECRPGTISYDGADCEPCPLNKYGRRCLHTCECILRQRCDPEIGCVAEEKSSTEKESDRDKPDENGMSSAGDKSCRDRKNILPIIFGFTALVGWILLFLAGIKILRKKKNERSYDQPGVAELIAETRPEYIELDSLGMYEEVDGYKMDQRVPDHTEKPFSGKKSRELTGLATRSGAVLSAFTISHTNSSSVKKTKGNIQSRSTDNTTNDISNKLDQ